VGALVLSFLAGALSLLSPCVLPLLPVVLAGALARHRLGPVALVAGLAVSATAFGFLFALLGAAVDRDVVRLVAAVLLIAFGVVMLSARLGGAFASATAAVSRGGSALLGRFTGRGLGGQVIVGALLGVVWTPCSGPTLGSAVTLAAQRESLSASAAVMAAYSAGAALPLLALAYGSRRALANGSDRLAAVARIGAPVVGGALLIAGALTLTGTDKVIEAQLVERLPEWLVELTTRF
jgi:cytochrome c biogenesis protein CcdA